MSKSAIVSCRFVEATVLDNAIAIRSVPPAVDLSEAELEELGELYVAEALKEGFTMDEAQEWAALHILRQIA